MDDLFGNLAPPKPAAAAAGGGTGQDQDLFKTTGPAVNLDLVTPLHE